MPQLNQLQRSRLSANARYIVFTVKKANSSPKIRSSSIARVPVARPKHAQNRPHNLNASPISTNRKTLLFNLFAPEPEVKSAANGTLSDPRRSAKQLNILLNPEQKMPNPLKRRPAQKPD